jgi:hypothetical protein
MAVPSTGAIRLRGHIGAEKGLGSSSNVKLNASCRDIIGKGAGVQTRFSEYRGAAYKSREKFLSWAAANYPSILTAANFNGNGRLVASCYSSMYGSPKVHDTSTDSSTKYWTYHSIQDTANAQYLNSSNTYTVYVTGGSTGYGALVSETVHGCTSSAWWDGDYGAKNSAYFWDNGRIDYRKMTDGRSNYSSFTGP